MTMNKTITYEQILELQRAGQLDAQIGRDEVYLELGGRKYQFQQYDLRNAKAAADKSERIELEPVE